MRMVNIMNYKLIVYMLSILFTTFGMASVDLNRFFKQGKVVEANIFAILMILAISELVASFIINFLEVSRIL